MNQNNITQGLLILTAPPSLEESLIDFLLQQAEVAGFTTNIVSGHGRNHTQGKQPLSIVEQVAGRQKQVQLMVRNSFLMLQALIEALKNAFTDVGIYYVLIPVADAGVI